ncbi:MAG: ribosome biogenesis GTPase YlqF [Lachnospiraceae bacterium]|nr:ribosome biogenesis GTPase YlqF [Lachnospiraceae bacterium]
MDIQWYPGHMTKARRAMEESLKLIDLIIELTDARMPASGRNPDIDKMGKGKYRLILLNKADLADPAVSAAWQEYYRSEGIACVLLDSRKTDGMKQIRNTILDVCQEKFERDRKRGIRNRPVRAMVTGIPNVGKSTFINSFAKRAAAKTGNRPGVTRGNQWIRLNDKVELLDTPGILWPKFEDPEVGVKLALIGTINDEILSQDELALKGIDFLKINYPDALPARYEGLDPDKSSAETLQDIALIRKCLTKGGLPDTDKAARLFLDDLRSGRFGRISFERPEAD